MRCRKGSPKRLGRQEKTKTSQHVAALSCVAQKHCLGDFFFQKLIILMLRIYFLLGPKPKDTSTKGGCCGSWGSCRGHTGVKINGTTLGREPAEGYFWSHKGSKLLALQLINTIVDGQEQSWPSRLDLVARLVEHLATGSANIHT